MSNLAAVKIVLDGGDIYFHKDEVSDVIVTPLKHFQVQTGDLNLPYVISDGDPWIVLQMRIRQTRSDTGARIRTVLDEKNIMTVYYALMEEPARSVRAFLLPDNIEFRYYNGEKAADVDFQLTFLECE